ncbi:hypothetical protein AZE42_05401 [Rhizopogon vesiculosus]|uniref:HNH nuclease domain-containing protein n=1 Tax=Rhizopogon vesiculosus TaxID=180088 RepID=A0A1J8QJY5_9AGAM|nr:hypothetical protein AZE42_05401 [Rhizopogon vesiculosus]
MQSPLPPNTYPEGLWWEGYNICLESESKAISALLPLSVPSRLVCARFLGYMIHEAPTDRGRDNISRKIIDCVDDDELVKLVRFYIAHFVHWARAGRESRSHFWYPSHLSFTEIQQRMLHLLHEVPQSHDEARERALFRDGYRCVLTGIYDSTTYLKRKELRKAGDMNYANSDACLRVTPTHPAYILPQTMNVSILASSECECDGDEVCLFFVLLDSLITLSQYRYAAEVWTLMQHIGEGLIPEEFDEAKIHCLENVMTLGINMHERFTKFYIWLEESVNFNIFSLEPVLNQVTLQPTPHSYVLNSICPSVLGTPQTVSFTTPDPVYLPLPSPQYLRLHAACARVLFLSGATGFFGDVLEDICDICNLAIDGSSLEHSLMKLHL